MAHQKKSTVFDVLRPHRGAVLLILVLQIIGVIAQIFSILLLKPMLDDGVKGHDMDVVIEIGVTLLILTAISSVVLIIITRISSKVAAKVSESLRTEIMNSLLKKQNLDSFDENTMRAMTILTSDVNSIQGHVFMTLSVYLQMPLIMILLIASTFMFSPKIAIMLLAIIVFEVIVCYLLSSRISPLYDDQKKAMDGVNNALREKVTGAETIRAYGGYDYEIRKFKRLSDHFGGYNRKVMLNSYYLPYLSTAIMWGFVVFIFLESTITAYRSIDPSEIVLFMQFAAYIVASLTIIPYLAIAGPKTRVCLERKQAILDSVMNVQYNNTETKTEHPIEIKNLTTENRFGMKSLDDVNIDISMGEITSIIGPSGSGTDTVIRIITGFHGFSSGKVIVNGLDVSHADPSLMREKIALAEYNPKLLRGSLRFNLDPQGKHSDEEILEMCDRIGLTGMVSMLPNGLDTVLADNRTVFSGGQTMQIAITRCLLHDADIYIFNNCFYSLDPESRDRAMSAIIDTHKGKTIVFAMNDTSTCNVSDRIFLLNNGQLEDNGTHDELIARSELYRVLYGDGNRGENTWA